MTDKETIAELRQFVAMWRENPYNSDVIHSMVRMQGPEGARVEVESTIRVSGLAHIADRLEALTAHDAAVKADAIEALADEYRSGQLTGMFLGRDDYAKAWLRMKAAAYRTPSTMHGEGE